MFRGKERHETLFQITTTTTNGGNNNNIMDEAEFERKKAEEARAFVEAMDKSSSSSSSEDEGENMELNDDDDDVIKMEIEASELFVFPVELKPFVLFNGTIGIKHDQKILQPSFPNFNPAWLSSLASDATENMSIRRSIASQDIMPMPVFTSPVLLYVMSKTDNSWRKPIVSSILSLVKLKQLSKGILLGCVPFHPSVENGMPQKLYNQMLIQLKLYSKMQDDRLSIIFKNEANEPMEQRLFKFINYMEEGTLYYIHMYEKFIFESIIEPHNTDACEIELENILTSYQRPDFVFNNDNTVIVRNMHEFFQLKSLLYKARDCESNFTFNLAQLPYRIEVVNKTTLRYNCPEGTVYKGYIDLLTIYEYFRFLDVDNLVDIQNWNPGGWRI